MGELTVRQRHLVLAATCLGFVVVIVDVSVVNVALAQLQLAFAAQITELQWVVNAYTLTFAAFLLTAGALGDRVGTRRVFITGFGLFTVASLGCGIAQSLGILIAARVAQGLGAALLVPASLSLLHQTHPEPVARARAVSLWAAAGGIALAAGPVLGGILIFQVGWRSIFLVNLPVGLLGIWLTARNAPPSLRSSNKSIDVAGQVTAILALGGLTGAITEAGPLGWHHPAVLGGIAISVLAAVLFVVVEAKSTAPMLPLSLFRNPTFSISSAVGLIVNFAFYGLVFVFSLFFQGIQQYSPLETGLAFLPMTAVVMGMNLLAGRLIPRVGARPLMVAGLLIAAAGYLALLPMSPGVPYSHLALPLLFAGSGIALTVPTMTNATLSAVDPSRSGIASGVLTAGRQTGGVLGVAVFGFLVRHERPDLFMAGVHLSLGIAAALLAAGAGLSFGGVGRTNQAPAVTAEISAK